MTRGQGARRWWTALALLVLTPVAAVGWAEHRRSTEAEALEREWKSERAGGKVALDATRSLEIVPLVNWHAGSRELRTEPGVSYLVRTDGGTLLFDLGFNRGNEQVPPLRRNMDRLGIALSEVDSVFISHAHRDHVGGVAAERDRSFSFGEKPAGLAIKRVFAPVQLTYPKLPVTVLDRPRRIGPGLATTGPIARRLFIGRIDEQALVIKLEGLGLVILVGCGHQTLIKLLDRVEAAFEEPVYAVVGDLHYPVPHGRLSMFGIDVQRRLASGDGPLRPITGAQIEADMLLLERRGVRLVALGGHDTSDEVLAAFARRRGLGSRAVEVGTPLRFGSAVR